MTTMALNAALLDLAEHGWVLLDTEADAQQVLKAVAELDNSRQYRAQALRSGWTIIPSTSGGK